MYTGDNRTSIKERRLLRKKYGNTISTAGLFTISAIEDSLFELSRGKQLDFDITRLGLSVDVLEEIIQDIAVLPEEEKIQFENLLRETDLFGFYELDEFSENLFDKD